MIRVHSKITEQLAPRFVLGHGTPYLFIFFKHYSELILVHKVSYFPTNQNVVFGVNVLRKICAFRQSEHKDCLLVTNSGFFNGFLVDLS